jgi:hypothetical protein
MRSGLVSDKQTRPVWPPYWPSILSRTLHEATGEEDIIFSDQPWAVAWYADRRSIWLPKKVSEFEKLEKLVEEQQLTSAGILMTPSSFKDNPLYKVGHFGGSEEFAALMLDGPSVGATAGGTRGLRSQAPLLSSVLARYPESKHLFPFRLVYYSKKPIIDQQR